ncbi:hypothetical protein QOL99_13715 [Deinococcus sp. MIMF12]|uniref:Uncharacterized protein n=1 Tax=Deinococcus rhizophilus TaxID=3049544 RepID=A0ABT7JL58_9DEIO|nr:hypothetical protein [Deinococcus rhizophilus]MDL2345198.1 hypothetical protein [Deinococcus rhizophilus]
MPPLGAPPTYSTPATLGLALLAILTFLWHFTLGALAYAGSGRYPGLALLLLSGLLLVYGVLTLIRYAEARDAMNDPQPRAAMYATPHESRVPLVGLCLAGLLVLADAAFALSGQLPPWHLAGLLLSALLARQAFRIRPPAGDD